MKPPDLESLILLPKEMAVEKYFRGYNWKWIKWTLFLFFFYFSMSFIAYIIWGDYIKAGLDLFGLIFTMAFFFGRHRIMDRADYIMLVVAFLMLQFVGIATKSHVGLVMVWGLYYLGLVHFLQISRKWIFLLLSFTVLWLAIRWYMDREVMLAIYGLGIHVPVTLIAIFTTASWLENRHDDFMEGWLKLKLDKEHSRMKRELDHAQEIQLSMLPTANPDLSGLDVASISIPASEVGGDYYDYFPLDDKRLALVIGDVSGHGVASGLVLSGVRSCLYLLKDGLPAPAALLGKLNRMLKQTTDKRMFMTMLSAVIDMENGEMTYASAGHPLLYHFSSADRSIRDIKERALPLGAIMKATYPEAKLTFEPGDYLLFFTDGIFEAADRDHAEYGLNRLRDKLKQYASKGGSAEHIRNSLLEDIRKFIGFQEQLDDMTMVVVKVSA